MRISSFIAILISFTIILSCSGKQKQQTKGIQKHFVVSVDSKHSYEIYFPQGYDSTVTYPVIFSFDSHGSGTVAVKGFELGADHFGFIVVGSNLIRNGIDEYEKHIGELITDVKSRFKIDSKALYTAGFSGGARMANYYGLRNQATGIISCSAGFRQADIQSTGVSCYVYNFAGVRDCNFNETAYLPAATECYANAYITENFTGIHEWPSSSVLYNALEFMYVRLVIDKIRDEKTVSVASILDKKKAKIDSLKATKNTLELYKQLEIASKIFAGTKDATVFSEQMKAMEQDNDFIKSLASKQQIMQMESMLNQGYAKAINDESLDWWTVELKTLNDSIKMAKNSDMIDLMYRSRAFIGLACFSFTQKAAKAKDLAQLQKTLQIYQTVEPQNPDVFYYKSIYALLKNQQDSVLANMEKAYKLGFEDSVRLQGDFPTELIQRFKKFLKQ